MLWFRIPMWELLLTVDFDFMVMFSSGSTALFFSVFLASTSVHLGMLPICFWFLLDKSIGFSYKLACNCGVGEELFLFMWDLEPRIWLRLCLLISLGDRDLLWSLRDFNDTKSACSLSLSWKESIAFSHIFANCSLILAWIFFSISYIEFWSFISIAFDILYSNFFSSNICCKSKSKLIFYLFLRSFFSFFRIFASKELEALDAGDSLFFVLFYFSLFPSWLSTIGGLCSASGFIPRSFELSKLASDCCLLWSVLMLEFGYFKIGYLINLLIVEN